MLFLILVYIDLYLVYVDSKGLRIISYYLSFSVHFVYFPQENGYTKEEMKVVWETQKIFELNPEDVKISCTAVRVPILRAHSEAITLETVRPVSAVRAR